MPTRVWSGVSREEANVAFGSDVRMARSETVRRRPATMIRWPRTMTAAVNTPAAQVAQMQAPATMIRKLCWTTEIAFTVVWAAPTLALVITIRTRPLMTALASRC